MQAISYSDEGQVAADPELRAWWTEIRTRGHPDADPAGWPVQDITTRAQLVEVLTTMIWVCTGMHAAGATLIPVRVQGFENWRLGHPPYAFVSLSALMRLGPMIRGLRMSAAAIPHGRSAVLVMRRTDCFLLGEGCDVAVCCTVRSA